MWTRRVLNTAGMRPLAWLLLRAEVVGRERIPRGGPFILMVNHCNFLDPIVAMYALLPREAVVLTKVENMQRPGLSLLMRLYGVIPVERGEADVTAIKRAIETLEQGNILLVAPEGTRSYHGRLLPAKHGMTFIALRTGVPILPVGVTGVKDFWSNLRSLRRTPVRANIGHPFRFRHRGHVSRQTMEEMTREAMYQLAALLPPEQWGEYADVEHASEEHIEFLEPGVSNLAYIPAPSAGEQYAYRRRLAGALE